MTAMSRVMGFALDLARIGMGQAQFRQFNLTLKNQTFSAIDQTIKVLLNENYITQDEYEKYEQYKKKIIELKKNRQIQ